MITDVACILRQATRSRDAVIRWGGEEFLIVLDKYPQALAAELAERIRSHVESHQDAEVEQLTLSLGLASLAPAETIEQLIARADAALYTAKRGGRNRLAVSQSAAAQA